MGGWGRADGFVLPVRSSAAPGFAKIAAFPLGELRIHPSPLQPAGTPDEQTDPAFRHLR